MVGHRHSILANSITHRIDDSISRELSNYHNKHAIDFDDTVVQSSSIKIDDAVVQPFSIKLNEHVHPSSEFANCNNKKHTIELYGAINQSASIKLKDHGLRDHKRQFNSGGSEHTPHPIGARQ